MTVTVSAGTDVRRVPRPRIEVLDVLRGVAILGTLATNIWIFTDPLGPAAPFADPARTAGVVETLLPETDGLLD